MKLIISSADKANEVFINWYKVLLLCLLLFEAHNAVETTADILCGQSDCLNSTAQKFAPRERQDAVQANQLDQNGRSIYSSIIKILNQLRRQLEHEKILKRLDESTSTVLDNRSPVAERPTNEEVDADVDENRAKDIRRHRPVAIQTRPSSSSVQSTRPPVAQTNENTTVIYNYDSEPQNVVEVQQPIRVGEKPRDETIAPTKANKSNHVDLIKLATDKPELLIRSTRAPVERFLLSSKSSAAPTTTATKNNRKSILLQPKLSAAIKYKATRQTTARSSPPQQQHLLYSVDDLGDESVDVPDDHFFSFSSPERPNNEDDTEDELPSRGDSQDFQEGNGIHTVQSVFDQAPAAHRFEELASQNNRKRARASAASSRRVYGSKGMQVANGMSPTKANDYIPSPSVQTFQDQDSGDVETERPTLAPPTRPIRTQSPADQYDSTSDYHTPVNKFPKLEPQNVHLQQVYFPPAHRQQQFNNNKPIKVSRNGLVQLSSSTGQQQTPTNSANANFDGQLQAAQQQQQAALQQPQRDLINQPQTIQITAIPNNGLGLVGANGLQNVPIIRQIVGGQQQLIGAPLNGLWNGGFPLDPFGRQVLMVNAERRQIDWSIWVWPMIAAVALPLVLGAMFVPIFLKTIVILIQTLQALGLLIPIASAIGQQVALASGMAAATNTSAIIGNLQLAANQTANQDQRSFI